MAINLNTQYSSKNVPISANYPYGQGMNVSAQGAGDAVPWEAAVFNDWNGYFQAVLSAASIVPSGTPDNAVTSQYLQALRGLFVQGAENLVNRVVSNLDANNLSGIYRVTATETTGTRPTGVDSPFAILIVNNITSIDAHTQIWMDAANSSNTHKIFYRNGFNTTWSAWRQITLAGDFGLGGTSLGVVDFNIPLSDDETFFGNYGPVTPNAPTTEQGVLINIVRGTGPTSDPAKGQLAITRENSVFSRTLRANVWQPWQRLQTVSDPKGRITSSSNLSLGSGTHTIPSDAIGMIIEVSTGGGGATRTVTYNNNIPNRVWSSTRAGGSGHTYTFVNTFDVFFYQDSSGTSPATVNLSSGLTIRSWIRSI